MHVRSYRAQGQAGRWRGKMSVKETIEIIALQGDAYTPSPDNVTSSLSRPSDNSRGSSSSNNNSPSSPMSLLWIPYVLIALVFIVFLGANFWCYHKKHRERYLRKRDEKRVKDGLHERRRITALMRSHFQSAFMSKNNVEEFVDEEDNVSIVGSGSGAASVSVSGPNSGFVTPEGGGSKLSQMWALANRLSPLRPSSPADRAPSPKPWKLFSGRSASTPDSLPAGHLCYAAGKASPGQVASPDSSGAWCAGKLSPAPSLSSNRLSPDQPWTGPERLSALLLRTLPGDLSPGSPLSPCEKLSPVQPAVSDTDAQTLFPSCHLSRDNSRSSFDKQSPVQMLSPTDKSPSFSGDKLTSAQTLPPDKLSPGQVSTLSDKLSSGDFLSPISVSSSPAVVPSNKLSPSQTWPSSSPVPGGSQRSWTNQNGSCRTNISENDISCSVNQETSNGSVVR